MKTKITILLAVLFLVPGLILAQKEQPPVSLMIHLEPHTGWLNPDEAHLSRGPLRIGLAGGIRLDYYFESHYAFSLGIDLNQTGGNLKFAEAFDLDLTSGIETLMAGTQLTYRLQFVEIPMAFKFMTNQVGYTRYFLEAGLDPMFNTKALIDATDNNIIKEPFQQGVPMFNLAWHAGIGFRYSFGRILGLQAALFYKNCFLDMTDENLLRKPDNTRLNQVGISIGLTLL